MVRGLLFWLSGLGAATYLAAASGWYLVLDRRPHNLVTWTDCVLVPIRWDEIKRKRGDAYIAEGLAAMAARNWSEAVLKIEAGLSRSPDNRRGREQLGVFYLAAGQRERGLKLMVEGFDRFYPGRDATAAFLRLAMAGDDFDRALAVVDRCLAQSGAAAERDRVWLVDQKMRILMVTKRFDDALSVISSTTEFSDTLRESAVVAAIELKRFGQARQFLDAWAGAGGSLGAIRRLRVRLAREEGDFEAMRSNLAAMRDLAPTDPTPWVYSLVQEQIAGQTEMADQTLNTYLLRFGGRLPNLMLALRPLVEIKAWPLFDKVVQRIKDLGAIDGSVTQICAEAEVDRGRFDEAHDWVERFAREFASDSDSGAVAWLEIFEPLIAFLVTGEEANQGELLTKLQSTPVALTALLSIATYLDAAHHEEVAVPVLEIAHRRFPGSQRVVDMDARVREVLGSRPVAKVELMKVKDGDDLEFERDYEPAASMNDGSGAAPELRSAKRFFERCDELIAEGEWSKLSGMIRDLRRSRPDWMNSNAGEILVREIALNIAEKNWPTLMTNVRFRLDSSLARKLEVMRWVDQLDDMKERKAASMILDELERQDATFPPARRKRTEWAEQEAAAQAAAGGQTSAEAPPTSAP